MAKRRRREITYSTLRGKNPSEGQIRREIKELKREIRELQKEFGEIISSPIKMQLLALGVSPEEKVLTDQGIGYGYLEILERIRKEREGKENETAEGS